MSRMGIGFSPEGKFKKRLTDRVHNGLKCYEVVDGEITAMAMVTTPAHSENATIISEEDRTIGGPVLIPDKMIYKINPITGEEYYIFFSIEATKKICLKYQKQLWTSEQLLILVSMYTDGKSTKDISIALKRDEQEVLDKIEKQKETFIPIVIILMSQKNKNTKEMADFLKINHKEILDIVAKMGAKIISKR